MCAQLLLIPHPASLKLICFKTLFKPTKKNWTGRTFFSHCSVYSSIITSFSNTSKDSIPNPFFSELNTSIIFHIPFVILLFSQCIPIPTLHNAKSIIYFQYKLCLQTKYFLHDKSNNFELFVWLIYALLQTAFPSFSCCWWFPIG